MASDPSSRAVHRVLVVDDDPSTLHLLEVILRDQGVDAVMALGSPAAQAWVRDHGVGTLDCALVDYRMPGLNGLELVAWLLSFDPALATVLMTAEGDMDLVTDALRQGVADYVEKPFRRSSLIASLRKAAGLTAERRYLMTAAEELRDVRTIHSRLVPGHNFLPAGFAKGFQTAFETAFHPAHESGGDFVNCFPTGNDRLLIVAGDVSGHDLKAAFISSYFQGLCRGMCRMAASLEQVREYYNQFLCDEWNLNRNRETDSEDVLTSLSVCFLLFDFSRMTLACLNNGFPQPVLCSADLSAQQMGDCGPPLGWFSDPETRVREYALPASGSVFLHSDGLSDQAESAGENQYAYGQRLLRASQGGARALLEGQRDDVLAVRFAWSNDTFETTPRLLLLADYPGDGPEHVDHFQKHWDVALQAGVPGMPPARRQEVLLCCREGLLNAMLHGSSRRPDRNCRMAIAFRNGRIAVRIDDEGNGYGFPPDDSPPRPGEHVSMGLRIIQSYSTHFSTSRNGASLFMEFSPAPSH